MSPAENLQRYAKLIQPLAGGNSPAPFPMHRPHDIPSLVMHQQTSGAFLPENKNIHPETQWFDELVILHAVANHAVIHPGAAVQNATRQAAEYHLREIQPDHATTDPWGLLAFIQYAPPLADQMLHAVRLNYPDGARGTALLLLQDVLYALQILMAEKT